MNHKYRKTVIAANWKMNKTPSETRAFGTELKRLLPKGRWSIASWCTQTSSPDSDCATV